MRGYFTFGFTTPGGLYLRYTYFPSCNLCFFGRCFASTFVYCFSSIYHSAFRDLVFLMWSMLSQASLSLSTPLLHLPCTSFGMSCPSLALLVPLFAFVSGFLLPFARCLLTRLSASLLLCRCQATSNNCTPSWAHTDIRDKLILSLIGHPGRQELHSI